MPRALLSRKVIEFEYIGLRHQVCITSVWFAEHISSICSTRDSENLEFRV